MKKIFLLLLVLSCFLVVSCDELFNRRTIRYEVKCSSPSGRADIEYKDAYGNTEFVTNYLFSSPFVVEFDVSIASGDYYEAYVMVQNLADSGVLTITIYADDEVVGYKAGIGYSTPVSASDSVPHKDSRKKSI